MFKVPEQFRVTWGPMASTKETGLAGAFILPLVKEKPLYIVASHGMGWEHVSVSLPERCPTWEEMCIVKDLFWDKEDAVMQLHPPESKFVNVHRFCLHLWRPTEPATPIPLPPPILVGPRSFNLPRKP